MEAINQLNHLLEVGIISIVITVTILMAVAFYFIKVKKIMAREEKVNYSSFNRYNSLEYTKFDRMMSATTNSGSKFGIMVVDETKFIAALDIVGYNFSSASAEERKRTMINSVALFNTVEKPIQMRQCIKAVDISSNIDKQIEIGKQLEYDLYDMGKEYDDLVALLEEYEEQETLYEEIEKNVINLQKRISSTKWKIRENNILLKYMKAVSGENGSTKKLNQMIFSYEYNANEFVQELTPQEIDAKACSELANMASIYTSSLANCGCMCRLLSPEELTDLIRRHNHPRTADKIHLKDLTNSSYNELFIKSDSLIELELQKVNQKKQQEMLEQYYKERELSLKAQKAAIEEYARSLDNKSIEYVAKETEA